MRVRTFTVFVVLLVGLSAVGQETASNPSTPLASAPGAVPRLMQFSGIAKDTSGKPLTGTVGITFLLYKDEQGGAPLWMETQNVQADTKGHYSAQLGATKPDGLPTDDFASGEARWLAVQIGGQDEQPRVLLLSVPYALKAADAATIGGLPPSAFVRANPEDTSLNAGSAASSETTTNGRTFVGGNSKTQPLTLQTVKTNGGTTNVLPIWTGTTTIGNSAISQSGSNVIVKSGSNVGIGTTSPTATLDVKGTALVEQTLNLPQTTSSTVGVINIGSFPFIHAFFGSRGTPDNTFVGGNAGNFTMTGPNNTAIGFQALHANTLGAENTALGELALSSNTTGTTNTAVGQGALANSTSGFNNTALGSSAMLDTVGGTDNTAVGFGALGFNGSGSFNAAIGETALGGNTTGKFNAGLGYNANLNSGNLTNATAIGANSLVSESNAIVLGCTFNCAPGTSQPFVGIGTTTPLAPLDVLPLNTHLNALIGDPGCGNGFAAIGFLNQAMSGCNDYALLGDGSGGTYLNASGGNKTLHFRISNKDAMDIEADGNVGINTSAPDNTLTVNGSADKPGGGSWGTFSDRRLKTLEGNFGSGLSQILKINPVRYRYKEQNAMGIHDRDEHVGLVAQDLQKVIPEAVTENSKGYLLINNDPILWAMLNAIKEQQGQIRKQQEQIRVQRTQIARLASQVKAVQVLAFSTNSRTGSQVRSAKAQVPMLHQ